jgi:hypothetical protein
MRSSIKDFRLPCWKYKGEFYIVTLTVVVYLDAKCSTRSARTNTQKVFHWPAKLNAVYHNTRSTFASICFIAFQVKYRFYYCIPSIAEHWILRLLPNHFPGFWEAHSSVQNYNSLSLSLRLCPPSYVPADIVHVSPFAPPSVKLCGA